MATETVNVNVDLYPPTETATTNASLADLLQAVGASDAVIASVTGQASGGATMPNVTTQPGQQGVGYLGLLDGTNRQPLVQSSTQATIGAGVFLLALGLMVLFTLKGKGL